MHFLLGLALTNCAVSFSLSMVLPIYQCIYMFILDSYMDGQLGFSGDNSLEPLLLEGFLELDPPGSSIDILKTKNNKSLKVYGVN